jgi:inner membrane protein involved in colicin E2 resistance
MVTNNQKRSIGKTIGFVLIVIGILYLGFFIFSQDSTVPPAAIVCVVVGVALMMISKKW